MTGEQKLLLNLEAIKANRVWLIIRNFQRTNFCTFVCVEERSLPDLCRSFPQQNTANKRERNIGEGERGRIKSVPGFYILQLWHTCCWEIHAIQLYHSKLLSYRSSFAVLSWRRKKYMWRLPPKAWFQHFRFMKLTEPDIKVLCSIYMLWLRPHTYLHGKKSARK